nr:O-methyltransferase 3-like isoform X2 [Coffea arabica]
MASQCIPISKGLGMSTCTAYFVNLLSVTTFPRTSTCTPHLLSTTPRCGLLLAAELDKQEVEVEHHYSRNAIHYWDKFYHRHKNKFFKDRHYLQKDWGQYFCDNDINDTNSPKRKVVLESHASFNNGCVNAFVCDVAKDDLCINIKPSSVDIVTLIFVLSAVTPSKMTLVLQNLKRVLKPDGHILLRDYALGDSAQVKLQNRNQIIDDNYCFRGDGTCAFYFSEDFLSSLFERAGFSIVDISTYCRKIENRSKNIEISRRWIRAIFSQLSVHPAMK